MIGSLAPACEIRSELRHSQGWSCQEGKRLARFAGVAGPSKKRIKPIDGGVSVVLKQAAVPR
jgi:hypothetical protein